MSNFLIPAPERVKQYEDHMEVRGEVLEIGTGSGVLAAMCARKGARRIVAVDINPFAVEHVRKTLPLVESYESDLFSNVSGSFDTIIFAAPWSTGEIKKPLDYALFDNGVVRRFFQEAGPFLKTGGTIWLQYCDAFAQNFASLPGWIREGGFRIEAEWAYRAYGKLIRREVNIILYRIGRAAA